MSICVHVWMTLFAAGCGQSGSAPAPAPPTPVKFTQVSAELSGGIAEAHRKLVIAGDGRYVVLDHDRPIREGNLGPELAVLQARLAKIDWTRVGPRYATDNPVTLLLTIRVTDSSGEHAVALGDPAPKETPPEGVVNTVGVLRPVLEDRPRTAFE